MLREKKLLRGSTVRISHWVVLESSQIMQRRKRWRAIRTPRDSKPRTEGAEDAAEGAEETGVDVDVLWLVDIVVVV